MKGPQKGLCYNEIQQPHFCVNWISAAKNGLQNRPRSTVLLRKERPIVSRPTHTISRPVAQYGLGLNLCLIFRPDQSGWQGVVCIVQNSS